MQESGIFGFSHKGAKQQSTQRFSGRFLKPLPTIANNCQPSQTLPRKALARKEVRGCRFLCHRGAEDAERESEPFVSLPLKNLCVLCPFASQLRRVGVWYVYNTIRAGGSEQPSIAAALALWQIRSPVGGCVWPLQRRLHLQGACQTIRLLEGGARGKVRDASQPSRARCPISKHRLVSPRSEQTPRTTALT